MDTGGVIGGGGPGGRKPRIRKTMSTSAASLHLRFCEKSLLKLLSVPGGRCIGLNPGRKNGGGGGGGGTPGPKPGGGIPKGGVKVGGWRAPTTGGPG
jgi:hypothetical protein